MKEKILKEARGAVAIFLVIILVPMMTISCLFVDISRVKLAKAMVDSAGDLTLNSALTQYDSLLQEYYGLFATSQSIDETLAKMDDFFIKCIKSAGLSDDDAQLFSKRLISSISSGDEEKISDMLNILVNPADFEMKRTPGGSICNPTLLKSQVVNFMKYRAPINGGLSLISSLKSFSNLSKETELIDKRKEYYEAEEAVNTKCKNAWDEINAYNGLDCCTDTEYFQKLAQSLSSNNGEQNPMNFRKRYRKILSDAYGYLYVSNNVNTGDKLSFENKISQKSVTISKNTGYPSGQAASGGTFTWYYTGSTCAYSSYAIVSKCGSNGPTYSLKTDSEKQTVTANTTTNTDLEAAIRNAYSSYLNLTKAAKDGIKKLNKNDQISTRYVFYCVENNKAYTNAAVDFANKMQILEHRYRWVADEKYNEGYTAVNGTCANSTNTKIRFTTKDLSSNMPSISGTTRTYQGWYDFLKKNFQGGAFSEYRNFASELAKEAKTALTLYNDKIAKVDSELESISNQIKDYKSVLKSASEHLGKASSNLDQIISDLSSSGSLAEAKNAWSESAEGIGDSSSIAAQDRAEIKNISKQFKVDDVQKLKDRIDNIKSNIDTILGELDKYKFGSKKLEDIKSYNGQLRGAIHGIASQNGMDPQRGGTDKTPKTATTLIGGGNSAGEAEELLNKGYQSGSVKSDWVKQASSNPYLKQQILNFYIYLYKNFNKTGDYNKITDKNNNELKEKNSGLEKNEKETEKEVAKSGDEEKGQVSKDNIKTSSNNINDKKNLPSQSPIEKIDGSQGKNNVGEAESSSIGDADSSAAAKNASSATSSLFKDVGSWLSSMGSNLRDNIYMTEYVMDMFSYDTIEKTGNSNSKMSGTTYPELKSLTCEGINTQNNFAYGSEIEYILYGGGNAANVATAYAIIYGVRLAFNLIYAFTNSELKASAFAIATPISAATCGIVPVPLIQYGLLAAAALGESGIDIANLKGGEKVPLYKTDQTWHFSFSNAIGSVIKGSASGIKHVANVAIDTGVEKISELLDKSEDELKNSAIKLDGQVELAFDTVFDEQINAVMNELTSLITSSIQNSANDKGDFKVENATDYVKSQLKQWAENDKSTGLTKKVRKAAVDYLLSHEQKITNIINDVSNTAGGGIEEISGKIESALSDIKTDLETHVPKLSDYTSEVEKIKNSINDSIQSGAGKIKDSLNNALDKLGDGKNSDGTIPTSGAASFFSFNYRDYLKLFLLIKFMSNGEATLLRMADVIQVNMAKVSNNPSYELKKSSCYLTLDCKTYIKPLFLAVPFIADTASISTDGGNGKRTFCFEYHYQKTKGY